MILRQSSAHWILFNIANCFADRLPIVQVAVIAPPGSQSARFFQFHSVMKPGRTSGPPSFWLSQSGTHRTSEAPLEERVLVIGSADLSRARLGPYGETVCVVNIADSEGCRNPGS